MAKLSTRGRRAAPTGRTRGSVGGRSTGNSSSSAPGIGQPVKVKTGYLWLSGNHGLEAFSGTSDHPLGVWRGTQGMVQSIRGDKILVGLQTNFSSRSPQFWVRQSVFWGLFEPA